MRIYKYKLNLTDRPVLRMPDGARILRINEQHGALCLWAEVDPLGKVVPRHFAVIPTGVDIPDGIGHYLGTALLGGGSLVLHVYEAEPSHTEDHNA